MKPRNSTSIQRPMTCFRRCPTSRQTWRVRSSIGVTRRQRFKSGWRGERVLPAATRTLLLQKCAVRNAGRNSARKGRDADLLYAGDANHNGIVDASENARERATSVNGFNGNARCGIMKYVTVIARKPTPTPTASRAQTYGHANVRSNHASSSEQSRDARSGSPRFSPARKYQSYRALRFLFQAGPYARKSSKRSPTKSPPIPAKIVHGLVNIDSAQGSAAMPARNGRRRWQFADRAPHVKRY